MVGFSWVSQLSSTPRRGQQPRRAHQDGAAAQRREGLVPPQVLHGSAQSGLVGGDGGGAPGKARQVAPAANDGHVVEDHEPGQVDLGRPDGGHLEVEDGGHTHVVAHEDVAELDIAPQQRRGRFGVRQVGPTPGHPFVEDRRCFPLTRPGQVPGPVLDLAGQPSGVVLPPETATATVSASPWRATMASQCERLPVEAVDPGQGVDHLVVHLGLAGGRGLGQPACAQIGLVGAHHPSRHPRHEEEG